MHIGPLRLPVSGPAAIPGFILTVVLSIVIWRVLFAAAQKASGNRLPNTLNV